MENSRIPSGMHRIPLSRLYWSQIYRIKILAFWDRLRQTVPNYKDFVGGNPGAIKDLISNFNNLFEKSVPNCGVQVCHTASTETSLEPKRGCENWMVCIPGHTIFTSVKPGLAAWIRLWARLRLKQKAPKSINIDVNGSLNPIDIEQKRGELTKTKPI